MHDFPILLTSVNAVKEFVNAATRFPCDVDVSSGRYRVDGKSIMGLFSIDLAGPVTVTFHGDEAQAKAFRAAIAAFLVKAP